MKMRRRTKREAVEAALWIAALDTVPIEERIPTVARWMKVCESLGFIVLEKK